MLLLYNVILDCETHVRQIFHLADMFVPCSDFVSLHEICAASKWQLALDLVERELNVPPVATGEEMAGSGAPNPLYLSYYLSQLRELLPHWKAGRGLCCFIV